MGATALTAETAQVFNDGESSSYQVAKQAVPVFSACPTESRELTGAELGALIVISVFPSRCRVRRWGVVVVVGPGL